MVEKAADFPNNITSEGFSLDSIGQFQVRPIPNGLHYNKFTCLSEGNMEINIDVTKDPEDHLLQSNYIAEYRSLRSGLAKTFITIISTRPQGNEETPTAYIGYKDDKDKVAVFLAIPLNPSMRDIYIIKNKEMGIIHLDRLIEG